MKAVTRSQSSSFAAFQGFYDQYLDNAAFLWHLRSLAVDEPHYDTHDLWELEQRIDAQLDGLMLSVEQSWLLCEEAMTLQEPGELFTAAVVAFRSHDVNKIQKVVEAGLEAEEATPGLISAFGWLPGQLVHGWLEKFLNSKDLGHKYLAVAACSLRGENPGEVLNRILQREDCQQHVALYSRSLRLVGEIRRQDLMPDLLVAMNSEQDDIRFWSTWSAILLGRHDLVTHLLPYVMSAGKFQTRAIDLAFRVMPVESARSQISALGQDQDQIRAVIRACAVLGDPHAVNWLIARMDDEACARQCGEAFSQITGIDLETNGLALGPDNVPVNELAGEADEPIDLDEDENLPWPDTSKVKAAWVRQGYNFIAGKRYFLGRLVDKRWLGDRVQNGFQRQRHAAALELALISTDGFLQNTCAKVSL